MAVGVAVAATEAEAGGDEGGGIVWDDAEEIGGEFAGVGAGGLPVP